MNGFKRPICAGAAAALLLLTGSAFSDEPAPVPATTAPAATQPSGVLDPVKEATTQPTDPPAETREGTMLNLTGQITYNAKHQAMLRFREHDSAPFKTFPILPNQNLERMESTLDVRGKETWFEVSVVVTVYQNHNYVLIRDASILLNKP